MTKIVFKEFEGIKKILSGICSILHEVRIELKEEGLIIHSMERRGICAVFSRIERSCFVEFSSGETFVVKAEHLSSVLRAVKSKETLSLEITKGKLVCEVVGSRKKIFEIPLLNECDLSIPPKTDLELKVVLDIAFDDLKESVSSATFIGKEETVIFHNDKKEVFISREEIMTRSKVFFCNSDIVDLIRGKYDSSMIESMISCISDCEKCIVKFDSDKPLILRFSTKDKFMMNFILAPRVAN